MPTFDRITIKGFKSIESAEIKLHDLNVVIGANGAGKSNLIGAFDLLEHVLSGRLQQRVAGDPDRFLHHGRKVTNELSLAFSSEHDEYGFNLRAEKNALVFGDEKAAFLQGNFTDGRPITLGSGHLESRLEEKAKSSGSPIPRYVLDFAKKPMVFHFHDTSNLSPIKTTANLEDNRFLRSDAANLPAFLYRMQEKKDEQVCFRMIEEHIRLVAPFFDRFDLAPSELDPKKIDLVWRQKGSNAYFDAYSLSDGTLRFICLAALLLQPSMPTMILLDEPELGLHPFALRVLAELLEAASKKTQVLLATQSVTLLDNFDANSVIVAENDGKKTTFNRPDEEKLRSWLEDYSLGELWEKNILGGRP